MFGLPFSSAAFLWIIPGLVVIAQLIYCFWDDRKSDVKKN